MVRSLVMAAVLALSLPTAASAQFMPALVPPNPLYQSMPSYSYNFSAGVTVPTAFGRTFVGGTIPFTRSPQLFSYNYGRIPPVYPWSGSGVPRSGYLSGGSGYVPTSQLAFEKAQREARAWANADVAKNLISEQWAYEKLGLTPAGAASGKPAPDALVRALGAATEGDVASGEALNQVLAAVVIAESKGGKGASPFLAPQQLDEIRFAGDAGEALNYLRQAGRLPFPAAFDAAELRDLRDTLDRDFSAAAAPLLANKPAELQKVMKAELSLKRMEELAPPVIRELSFEQAIEARRFLNRFHAALRGLKARGAADLVNSTWATEGSNVGDLVKHMSRNKLQFAPAVAGSEPTYLALHKGLATYLFVLTQSKK